MKPIAVIGLSLLCLSVRALPASWPHPTRTPPLPIPASLFPPNRPATPFERSLRQAWSLRTRALLAEIREREALESWDPTVTAGAATESLRQQHLMMDRSGDLRRAETMAEQAAVLAGSPMEAYRAASLLALIECSRGEHQDELRQARKLMALAPQSWRSREAWRRAAQCNGLDARAEPANDGRTALEKRSNPGLPRRP